MSREIEVWGNWRELGAPMRMGHLRSTPSRGKKEVFSFSYDQAWLDAGALAATRSRLAVFQRPPVSQCDGSPDRWGRLLMQRREAAQARVDGRSAHRLQETDYLLGVHDEQRTGALRFKEPARSDEWQCDEPWMRTPPWASLRELEHASWNIQDDSATDDPHYLNVSETDNALDFELALEVAPFFRLKPVNAEAILQQVKQTVRSWQSHAKALGIPQVEQEVMSAAFAV